MDRLPPPALIAEAPPSRSLEDILRLWSELRKQYAVLPDVSASLQKIPSALANGGMTPDGRVNLMVQDSFDNTKWDDDARRIAYLRQGVAHEAGHTLSQTLGPSGMSDYWQARGLPGTPEEQFTKAWNSVKNTPNPYNLIHERLPEEMFAEDFAGLSDPSYKSGAETTFGVPYSRDAMQQFFSQRTSLTTPQLPVYDIPGLDPGVNPFASVGPRA